MSKRPGDGGTKTEGQRWPAILAAPAPAANFNAVLDLVRAACRVQLTELMCPTRANSRAALARQIAMYLIHVDLGATLTETAHTFARDRTTAAHACGLIENRRDDKGFDLQIRCLEEAVRAAAVTGTAAGERRWEMGR